MRKLKCGFVACLVVVLFSVSVPIQTSEAGSNPLQLISYTNNHVELKEGSNVIFLDVIESDAIRIQVMPDGVTQANSEVVARSTFNQIRATISRKSNQLSISTANMQVTIDLNARKVTLYNANKTVLLQQMDLLETMNDQYSFRFNPSDKLYGLTGYSVYDNSSSKMLRNQSIQVNAGGQGDAGAPFVWSTKGYGVLIDTIDAQYEVVNDTFRFRNTSKSSPQYYLMVGTPAELMATVTDITGKPPLFPKWAMGFTNSEWGMTEDELLQHVFTYREKQIPIDNFTLDFDWKAWGEDDYGEFRWNTDKFPNGPSGELYDRMQQLGVQLTGIFKPRIHVNTVQGNYATQYGYWWPEKAHYSDYFSQKTVNDLNFLNQNVRTWYFNQIKSAYQTGIRGFWNDEADVGYPTLQGFYMQKMMYDGQRKLNNERVWSLNRNFYLGAQRYAYGMWSGDIRTGFASMAAQRERMLAAINLGQTKWGMDIGGFNGTPNAANYARWMQFGAFVPIFRVHGSYDQQRQPWQYGAQAEKIAKAAIEMRYRLIPYIYSYEKRANETGVGIVKPLLFDYPTDAKVANLVDSWMFGDYLLVSPIVTETATSKSIYLPKGTWIDYVTGAVYSGGKTITHKIDVTGWTDIPVFIKEGAIIAKQPLMNYVGEKPTTTIQFDVFPSTTKSSFTYYNDDGKTYSYEKGIYLKQTLTTIRTSKSTAVNISSKTGTYSPDTKYYLMKVYGRDAIKVTNQGKIMKKMANISQLNDLSGEGWIQSSDKYGDVTIIKVNAGQSKTLMIQQR